MKQFFTNKEDNTSVKQSIEGKSKSSACSDSDIPEIESPAVSSIKSKKCKEVPNNNNKTAVLAKSGTTNTAVILLTSMLQAVAGIRVVDVLQRARHKC